MQKEIFEMAHDQHFHQCYHRCIDRIRSSFYIRQLAKNLKAYIRYCPQCIHNQTARHPTYGSLQPVQTPTLPFHTICVDLITHLSKTPDGYDALLPVTCKASKKTLLLPGNKEKSSDDWGLDLARALLGHDWGFPKNIISNRDLRFIAGLFAGMFKAMNTKFLTTTAHNPQSDGQSKRTNQTVGIALRYFITANPELSWTEALPLIQWTLNTSKNDSTGVSPNEYVYGFNPHDALDTLTDTTLNQESLEFLRRENRDAAQEALAFAQVYQKYIYDGKHKPISLKPRDMVALRLHHGYRIQGHLNHKVSQQRVGPLQVLERVGKNAYLLDVPEEYKIWPVVNIAQWEPYPKGEDPFGRVIEARPGPVTEEGKEKDYEIERFIDRRINKRNKQLE
jgi:hypothetical protein